MSLDCTELMLHDTTNLQCTWAPTRCVKNRLVFSTDDAENSQCIVNKSAVSDGGSVLRVEETEGPLTGLIKSEAPANWLRATPDT